MDSFAPLFATLFPSLVWLNPKPTFCCVWATVWSVERERNIKNIAISIGVSLLFGLTWLVELQFLL